MSDFDDRPELELSTDNTSQLVDENGAVVNSASDVITLTGRVKWFDPVKGFGFIVPDNGMPDALLHITCLRRDGYQMAYEGAEITFEALRRNKGLQTMRVVEMKQDYRGPIVGNEQRTHDAVDAAPNFVRAEIKWFNRLRGYGFANCGPGSPDIFIHMEALRIHGLQEVMPGQIVEVRYGETSRGLMASEVRLPGQETSTATH